MAFWLMKTEPGSWSWDQQVTHGRTHWDGVRNYQASGNMKSMLLGDYCFFYHSIKEKSIRGIVKVCRLYYPDHTDESGRFGMVDVETVMAFGRPVSLEEIKKETSLSHLPLLRQSRLSVMPIDESSWELICKLGQIHWKS
jgi:predicted RNA-binding protein with PUA-like domain